MTGYKAYVPPGPLLVGYDPYYDLADDHLARLVDETVDELVSPPPPKQFGAGQPERDPRVLIKVLLYSVLTKVHSSRRMAQNCCESLPYLYLVRDDRPCHTVLAQARRSEGKLLKDLFRRLHLMAQQVGILYLGRIAVDSSKFAANASKASVIQAADYDKALETFDAILKTMEETDAREDSEKALANSETGVSRVHMREVLRMIGKEIDGGLTLTPQMTQRVKQSAKAVEAAKAQGLSHVSVTDPDARMMPIGSSKKQGLGHILEAVADGGNLIVGQTGNHASDGGRLLPLFEKAREADLVPVTQVTADTGYYCGGHVHDLLAQKIEVIVPDQTSAREMKFGPPSPEAQPIEFIKVQGRNAYVCPAGNFLQFDSYVPDVGGQRFSKYVAAKECTDCPLASRCLKQKNAKRRHLRIGEFRDELEKYNAGLLTPEKRDLYYERGPAIETVFALLRTVFGFDRWHVRGSKSVESEGVLVCCAYQLKKIYARLQAKRQTLRTARA
jgi:transposase